MRRFIGSIILAASLIIFAIGTNVLIEVSIRLILKRLSASGEDSVSALLREHSTYFILHVFATLISVAVLALLPWTMARLWREELVRKSSQHCNGLEKKSN